MIATPCIFFGVFVVLFVCKVSCDEEDLAARIFVYKSTNTAPVVEGKEFAVTYQIFNNGDGTASNIEINDRYDPNSFAMRENVNDDGFVRFSIEELVPGAEESFNVTVEPKLFGIYESTRARITYSTGMKIEDVDDDIRSGFSTSLGRVKIISEAEHLRNSSYWMREWLIYLTLCGAATLLPFSYWTQARIATEKISAKRKSN